MQSSLTTSPFAPLQAPADDTKYVVPFHGLGICSCGSCMVFHSSTLQKLPPLTNSPTVTRQSPTASAFTGPLATFMGVNMARLAFLWSLASPSSWQAGAHWSACLLLSVLPQLCSPGALAALPALVL